MAESRVEGRRVSVWPWIIGLLILALLVWALTELLSDNTEPVLPETVESAEVQPSEPAPFPASVDSPAPPLDTTTTIPEAQGMTADTAR